VLTNTNNKMANRFLNWIDRVGLPLAAFVSVTGSVLMFVIIIIRLLYEN
jgi:uncharacterized membrane protein